MHSFKPPEASGLSGFLLVTAHCKLIKLKPVQ